MTVKPLKLKPVIKDYIWGTEKWLVSTHPDGESVIEDGEYAGQTLTCVLEKYPEWIGDIGTTGMSGIAKVVKSAEKSGFSGLSDVLGVSQNKSDIKLPILIKHITAWESTSLQVHPSDEYIHAQKQGKNEMWYVLKAEQGAEMILGLNKPHSKKELRDFIESDSIMTKVRHVPVFAGDCYCIPAGMLHTFGSGVTILEVQQNSNVTYRVYDYGRVDSEGRPRELHIDKALDVIDPSLTVEKAKSSLLSDWEYFKSELITVDRTYKSVSHRSWDTFECLVPLAPISLQYNGGSMHINAGEAVFIPAVMGDYTLETDGNNATVMAVTV